MKAGPLNRLIAIQTRTVGEDAAGQPVDTWTTTVTVWANVLGATGMASIRNSSPHEGVSTEINAYSFRIRFLEGLTAGVRVLYNSVPFDVKQVRMDYAGREWTDLVCELGGNAG